MRFPCSLNPDFRVFAMQTFVKMHIGAQLCETGIGGVRLFTYLRQHEFLDIDNIPYQEFLDNGFFYVIEKVTVDSWGTPRHHLVTLISLSCLRSIRSSVQAFYDGKGQIRDKNEGITIGTDFLKFYPHLDSLLKSNALISDNYLPSQSLDNNVQFKTSSSKNALYE